MIDRGNRARAGKAHAARTAREALLRKALLGSTALIGVTIATPALAQVSVGGGTLTGTGILTNHAPAGGGVQMTATPSSGIRMAGVTIANTSGTPTTDAYQQVAASGESAVLDTAGTNNLSTTQSDGAALRMIAANGNLTWAIGQIDPASVTNLTGSYGAHFTSSGFINVVDFGTVSSLRNVTSNGAVGGAGILASAGTTVNLSLKAPTISDFTTGISATSGSGTTVTTTGGSIRTLPSGTGIYATATAAGAPVTVSSGSAIDLGTSGTGIRASSNNGDISVTTTAGGTINGGGPAIRVDSASAGHSTTVTVGAAIGDSARPSLAVFFSGNSGGTNTVNVNANISSSGGGSFAIGTAGSNIDLTVNVASGVAVDSQGPNAIQGSRNLTVANNGTIRGANNGILGAGAISVTNSGTITAGNGAAIDAAAGGTITNNVGGAITGGTSASDGWAVFFRNGAASAGQTINNSGIIRASGGAGAIRIDSSAASTLNLYAGSTVNGLIQISGRGTTTTDLAGMLLHDYDASTATGAQYFRLASSGSMLGATFGSGNDIFTWTGGGNIGGAIDAGGGTDTFAFDLGSATSQAIDQSNFFSSFIGFENYSLVSGNLTLTGIRNGGGGWTVAGGAATAFTLNGSLTNITGVGVTLTNPDQMYIQSGAQLSATGDVIYSSGNGNNIENRGTITAGSGLSSGIAFGSGTVNNYGLITYAGGSATTQGNGILASTSQLSLTNHAGASLIGRWDGARANNGAYVINDGLIRGDRFAGVEIAGTSTIINNATGRIFGATAEGAGLLINSGAVRVTNAGQIVGEGPGGIHNVGAGLLSVSNSGTIATGTLNGSNNYNASGWATGIRSGSANITNTGLIEGAAGGIATGDALTLTNTGTITGYGNGGLSRQTVMIGGVANILNSGTIRQSFESAIFASGGGTITNAVSGTIAGGTNGSYAYAVYLTGGGTFNNYGLANSVSGGGVRNGDVAATINLFSGSITGNILSGAGNDTLAIYSAEVRTGWLIDAYTDAVSGALGNVQLQNSGTQAAAAFGTIDLGGGNDTLQLRGTGTGAQAGEFGLATATGAEILTKLDSGTWTLSGTAITPGVTIHAGTGAPAGTLIFAGSTGLTGAIYVNGATVRANNGGAFGTATLHMVDPTVEFAAAGTYANNFLLEVGSPASADPTVFGNISGGAVALDGNITTGSGINTNGQAIDLNQAVTFNGTAGGVFLLRGTNNWSGATTIDTVTVIATNGAAIGDGSTVTVNSGGGLVLQDSETIGGLAGAGSVELNGSTLTLGGNNTSTTFSGTIHSTGGGLTKTGTGTLTLSGANTYTGTTTITGGTLALTGTGTLASSGIVNNATFDISGRTSQASIKNLTGTGSTVLGNNTLNLTAADGTYSGVISGNGAFTVAGGGLYTLTGFNTYTGPTVVNGAGTRLQVGDGANSGRIAGDAIVNGTLIYARNDNYDFTGAISGGGTFQALGTVSLSGTINTGNFVVDSATGGTVTITGTRNATTASGVLLAGAGNTLRVGLTGSIAGGAFVGVRLDGTGNGVDNFGSITNSGTGSDNNWGTAIAVLATSGTSTINNGSASNSSATIGGYSSGINHVGSGGVVATGLLTVNNYGTITGARYNGIENQGGSGALTVNNYATGTIVGQGGAGAGAGNGINSTGTGTLTLTNAGLVAGRSYGILTGGSVNITNSGTIAAGTLSGGTITASGLNGIQAIGGGTITNNAGGVIRGSFLDSSVAIASAAGMTVNNYGQILGAALGSPSIADTTGVRISTGIGSVTNYAGGLILGGRGTYFATGGTVTNSGTIAGNLNNGVENATTLINNAGGRVFGLSAGATMLANATVTNEGTIAAATYNALLDTVTATTGTGLVLSSASVTNSGTISGGTAINVSGTLTLTNTGTITGTAANGITTAGLNSAITNSGMIRGATAGTIFLAGASGTITNQTGGTITGANYGIQISTSNTVVVSNSGTIVGTGAGRSGISVLNGTGNVTNQAGGTIVGQNWGVSIVGTGTVVNSGLIGSGTLSGGTSGSFTVSTGGGNGVILNGGSVTNNAGGTIIGGNYGIGSGGTTGTTITNNGTIIGGSYAISTGTANSNDTVTLGANSVTNGAIALGAGNDTLNWHGGSFTSIDAGAGTDSFNAILTGAATLDLATLSNFDAFTQDGGTLTLSGSQTANAGWTVLSGSLALDGTATVSNSGTAVTLAAGTSLSIAAGGSVFALNGNAIDAATGAGITNAGLIMAIGTPANGAALNGGTLTNQASGTIFSQGDAVVLNAGSNTITNAGVIVGTGNGVTSNAAGQTLTNSGIIATGTISSPTPQLADITRDGTGSAVEFTAGGAVTNQAGGQILGNVSGVVLGGTGGSVSNAGTIEGGTGWGVDVSASATSTITNSGIITGGALGAIQLAGTGDYTVTLAAGSTTNGNIVATGTGTRTVEIAGMLNGSYDASGNNGVDNITLRAGGTLTGANLGGGNDVFTYYGGTITGMVDGGAGTDLLRADFGAGNSGTVSLANFVNFEEFGLVSGDLTLTDASTNPGAVIHAGFGSPAGMITFDGTSGLTGDIYVNGGTIRAATAGAFGTGTIHMIDPTAIFGATGTYANNIDLAAVDTTNDPATLRAEAGVVATLTGAITESVAGQNLVFEGNGIPGSRFVLTNAANSWTGTTTIAGGVLTGTTASISGSNLVLVDGAVVFNQAASGTVSAGISGTGNVYVGGLAAGNTFTFAGTNQQVGSFIVQDGSAVAFTGTTNTGTATSVLLIGAGGSLTNSGSISGTNGVESTAAGVSVTNLAGGTITNTGVAIRASGANTIVDNYGAISGGTLVNAAAVTLTGAGAVVTNQAGATITGWRGVAASGANAVITNYGTITGTADNALTLQGGGTATNALGGVLNATAPGGWGIYLAGSGTATNNGTINADIGITFGGNGVRTATNTGTINGISAGVATWTGAGSATLDNSGTIAATTGSGVNFVSGGTVTNSGTITGGTNGYGIATSGTTFITNQAGGTISGGLGALYLEGASTIFVTLEAGSTTTGTIGSVGTGTRIIGISGTFTGNYIGGDGSDTLTIDTGAAVSGTLSGGGGSDLLQLSGSGSATLNSIVTGFESVTKLGTGTWTLAGATDAAYWTVYQGTLVTGGAIDNAAQVNLFAPGTLQLNGDEAIGSLSGAGTVALGSHTLALLAGTTSFDGTLNGTGNLLIDGAALTFGGTAGHSGITEIRSGSLTLATGASFNPASTLVVGTAGTLDLADNTATVGLASIKGVLNGTGTLTAGTIGLDGATVNANLAGTVVNSGGISTLNGTVAGNVAIEGGTLALGAADRLADTATVAVAAGAVFDIGSFSDTIGALALAGTLNGSGTLTAGEYQLTGATVNANLGAGTVFNLSGTSTLNGTAGGNVSVQAGTLTLGAANRLADTATVAVASGADLNIGTFNDTIGVLALAGTLNGTGTLTAAEYQLTGATVNANLGAGTLFNLSGSSTLNGTAGGNVSVQGGTLVLGATDRLADTATVLVASGATLSIGGYTDTVALLALQNGTLAGTGTLTASEVQLTGATVNANLGATTLYNLGGTSTLNGTATGNVSVQGGTLVLGAANRLADTAIVAVAAGSTLDLGTFSDTVGALALNGTLAGTGTLTAAQYQLNNATVNANLGAGTLFNLGGSSVLNGTTGGDVSVQAGTLALGGSNHILDTATLAVSSGATFDLGANSETVGLLALGGTLNGTGTLTAAEYQLSAATVNANIGGGSVYNLAGTSTLNGTVGASNVTVQAGTLRLGASNRLANTTNLGIATGATFDLAGYTQTVGTLAGTGTLALGSGKLVLANSAEQSFGGAITGSGSFEKQGLGRLNLVGTFAHTGSIDVTAGTLAFSGSSQGSMRLQGGTLIGSGNLAGALTLSSGSFSPGGLAGAMGGTSPIGSWTVGSLVATGGNLLFDVGGISLNFASDTIKVNGTATLSGGTVAVNALSAAASDYRFNQTYVILQAGSLSGTFSNGATFADVSGNNSLKWRLRYDLMPNAVVLQVQKGVDFAADVGPGDPNSLAVAQALMGAAGAASDEWSATLNSLAAATQPQRLAAYRSFTGEALANLSSATIAANNQFTGLLRQRIGDGSDALIGGGFAGASLADVRTTTTAGNSFASSLAGASLPGVDAAEEPSNGGIWGQVYGGYQKLLADGAHAGLDNTTAGVAMGVETRFEGFTLGVAGGVAQLDLDMNSRASTVSGTQYQLGGYASYDAGSLFIAASGSWYSGDFDSKRTLSLGTTASLATGDISSKGYSFGLTGGFRTELGNGLRLALIGSASKVHDKRDGFTESAAGGLGLEMAKASRDLFTATGELRLGAQVKTGAGVAMPWVSAGVRYNSGDLDTLGAMRFAGAPAGQGSFGVSGVRIAPVLGTLGVGIDARASKNVRLGIALEGSAGENTREGRASVRVKIGF